MPMGNPLETLKSIVGPKGWLETASDIEPYITEHRGKWRGSCALVVRPTSVQQISDIVRTCSETGITITPQGGNTGLVGGGVPQDGIVLSLERLNKIRHVDPVNNTMSVDGGCVLTHIQKAADDVERLFPLSLAAEGSCQIGGNLSTNAGGVQVLRYGNTRDLTLGLEVVLPDGQIWNGLRSLRKDNTGYDLKHLFIGAEGTLGIITGVILKLFPRPKCRETALVSLNGAPEALDLLIRLQSGAADLLTTFEYINGVAFSLTDQTMAPFQARPPACALIELSGFTTDGSTRQLLEEILSDALENGVIIDAVIAESETQSSNLWSLRESLPHVQSQAGGSIKHDVSVPISRIPEFLEKAEQLILRELPGIRIVAFGHMGDGNLHYNLSQPKDMDTQVFLGRWEFFSSIIHDLADNMNGSFSAEHGVGLLKRSALVQYKSSTQIELMKSIKRAIDPRGIMNPGKVL